MISNKDYYPFGSTMPERVWNGPDYRFGFNGMEKESDITDVDGGHLDFGARIYDARLGNFLSLDPLAKEYTSLSDYSFVANNFAFVKDLSLYSQ